jgi:hypothetical protein
LSGAVQLGCWARGAGASAPRAPLDLRRRGAAARWGVGLYYTGLLGAKSHAVLGPAQAGGAGASGGNLRHPSHASRRRGRTRTPYRMVFISVKVTLRVSISFFKNFEERNLTIFFSINGPAASDECEGGNGLCEGRNGLRGPSASAELHA